MDLLLFISEHKDFMLFLSHKQQGQVDRVGSSENMGFLSDAVAHLLSRSTGKRACYIGFQQNCEEINGGCLSSTPLPSSFLHKDTEIIFPLWLHLAPKYSQVWPTEPWYGLGACKVAELQSSPKLAALHSISLSF